MSTEHPMPRHNRRIADELDRLERRHLVGRDREIERFQRRLMDADAEWRILNLHGTGGAGKSFLLDEFRRIAGLHGARFLYMDSRSFTRNPHGFCSYLLQLLSAPATRSHRPQHNIGSLVQTCVDRLRKAAARGTVVLAIDTFEEIGELEHWLRSGFLIHLDAGILTIISGRLPLQGEWISSPAWRKLICRMPLGDLPHEAVRQYLELAGITDESTVRHIWAKTKGHPLTLSLMASALPSPSGSTLPLRDDRDVFAHVVRSWLREAPDPGIRELVEAAAVLRHFNQETLGRVLERDVPTEQFLTLIGYSFVRRIDRGWVMHDLLREAVTQELLLRAPETYDRLWKRCVLCCRSRIGRTDLHEAASWESADWFYYIGDRFIRSMFYQQTVDFQLEPLHPSNWNEVERYIDNRILRNRDIRIVPADSGEGGQEEYWITVDEALLWLQHIRLRELHELDPGCVQLLRDAEGNMFGFAVIIPIHEGTWAYLCSRPPSATFFAHLPDSEQQALQTPRESPAGYFIQAVDVCDYADPYMRQAAGLTFIRHMLSAGFVVTTVPVVPLFHAIFRSLGFRKARGVVHYDYGDRKPTPYFVLDIRGKKLLHYLDRMIASFGLEPEKSGGRPRELMLLSRREREVAERVLQGRTNREIAAELYISEATVKKHVLGIFKKLKVKNRVQLINRLGGSEK